MYNIAVPGCLLQSRSESDNMQLRPCAKLQAYLESLLELVDDVIWWWGVSFHFIILMLDFLKTFLETSNSISDPFMDGLRLPFHPRISYTF